MRHSQLILSRLKAPSFARIVSPGRIIPRFASHLARCASLCTVLILLASCTPRTAPPSDPPDVVDTGAVPLNKQQASDLAWQALEPNTSSHDPAAWETTDVRIVFGREVTDLFDGDPEPGGCAPGPPPPDNTPIVPRDMYWYVLMKPLYATSQPVPSEEYSPTAPSRVPEPFVYEAHILLDARTGQIVARKIACVIY